MNEILIWRSKEFRDAKKNYELDSKCSQCGSTEELTPHHVKSYKSLIYANHRKLAIPLLCESKGVTFTESAIYKTGGFSSSRGYIQLKELVEYIKNHPEIKEKSIELAREEYFSFTNITTLCKRCHFALEKGMSLCYICKKNYHKQNFESCFACKNKHQKMYNRFERRMNNNGHNI